MYFCCVQIHRVGASWFKFPNCFTTNSYLEVSTVLEICIQVFSSNVEHRFRYCDFGIVESQRLVAT